jgi:predicted DNA binding protein
MKHQVIQLPDGTWAVIRSIHENKGAADKAANELPREKTFKINLTEKQVQVILDALSNENR